jgi:hypothetical protein
MKKLLPIFLLFAATAFAQEIQTPFEKNNFAKATSYDELSAFIRQLDQSSEMLTLEIIGKSVKGRNLYAMKFSEGVFGEDISKIKVLIFAQQHGNEQSGKEGALLLAKALLKPENKSLFRRIDLVIIPQINPDGSEVNQRRNGNDADLNRNHLILTETETMALHKLFDSYLFEVTMDVHEYYPYDENWMKLGFRKDAEITLGVTTNTNVSAKIRKLSNEKVLPFLQKNLKNGGFSSFVYCPGGPPDINYIRHSTFDINDGRQSLGIQNTLSFIQEGMNGTDSFTENLQRRAAGQMAGMMGLINYSYKNYRKIKKIVAEERATLISGNSNQEVSIQSEHVASGKKLALPVLSLKTGKDSVITVSDYRPVVKSLGDVAKPEGYLIPKTSKPLVDWVRRQALQVAPYNNQDNFKIEQYFISKVDSIDFEGDIVANPTLETREIRLTVKEEDYLFVPTAQLKGNLIVIALEPKSILGLATYNSFNFLMKKGESFPVLRVVKKEK